MTFTMFHLVPPNSGTIFPKGENAEREGQQRMLRPVAFRPHLAMGLPQVIVTGGAQGD